MKNERVVAHLNPNTLNAKEAKGEREASRQGRRLFSGTPYRHATGPGSSAHFTPDPLSSCHETSSIGSTVPLLCPD